MTRCTKKDDGNGKGCIKEAGHGSRCKVRDLGEAPEEAVEETAAQPAEADDKLAETIRVFAANLGLKPVEHPHGEIYSIGSRSILVTPSGHLRPVELKIGEALTI